MRPIALLSMLVLTGCSTHPVADMMDFFHPGKMYPNDVEPYGGVCIPQGAVLAPAPQVCPPAVPPGPGVVPPPVPLPPNAPGAVPPPAFPVTPLGP